MRENLAAGPVPAGAGEDPRATALRITKERRRHLATLIRSIGSIDEAIDRTADAGARRRLCGQVLSFLAANRTEAADPLDGRLASLRRLIEDLDIREGFLRGLRRLFSIGEKLRATRETDAFVRGKSIEGALGSRLFLLVLCRSTRRSEVSELLTPSGSWWALVDAFFDARRDYRNREVIVYPGPRFYRRLVTATFGVTFRTFVLLRWRHRGLVLRLLLLWVGAYTLPRLRSRLSLEPESLA